MIKPAAPNVCPGRRQVVFEPELVVRRSSEPRSRRSRRAVVPVLPAETAG